jgi:flagella basal body P-ring formation protein FlgA
MTRRLSIAVVTLMLLLTPRELTFAGGATRLSPETLTAIAREWLVERLHGQIDRTAIEVTALPHELVLPSGEVSFNFALQSGSLEVGTMTVLVEAIVADARGGRSTRSATVNFKVDALRAVVVAVRELSRRAIVGAGDVRLERRPPSRIPAGAAHDLSDVVGKEISRPLAPGEAVTTGSVTAPSVIRRGTVVSLVLEGPNFRIVARGVALEDGSLGGPIRVVNQSSRREVVGRVEDERTVRVSF